MDRRLRVSVLILLVSLLCVFAWAGPATAIQFGQPDGVNHPYVCIVVFYDDNDAFEMAQGFSFTKHIACPRILTRAAGVKVRAASGVTGTVTPWLIDSQL